MHSRLLNPNTISLKLGACSDEYFSPVVKGPLEEGVGAWGWEGRQGRRGQRRLAGAGGGQHRHRCGGRVGLDLVCRHTGSPRPGLPLLLPSCLCTVHLEGSMHKFSDTTVQKSVMQNNISLKHPKNAPSLSSPPTQPVCPLQSGFCSHS